MALHASLTQASARSSRLQSTLRARNFASVLSSRDVLTPCRFFAQSGVRRNGSTRGDTRSRLQSIDVLRSLVWFADVKKRRSDWWLSY